MTFSDAFFMALEGYTLQRANSKGSDWSDNNNVHGQAGPQGQIQCLQYATK